MIFFRTRWGSQNLCGQDFLVWARNYRLQAWKSITNKFHFKETNWHIFVDFILLNLFFDIAVEFITIQDLNKFFFFFFAECSF